MLSLLYKVNRLPNEQVNVRFPKEELTAIDEEAKKRDWTRSHIVRRAVIDWLKTRNERSESSEIQV